MFLFSTVMDSNPLIPQAKSYAFSHKLPGSKYFIIAKVTSSTLYGLIQFMYYRNTTVINVTTKYPL